MPLGLGCDPLSQPGPFLIICRQDHTIASMMDIALVPRALETVGTLLIGYAALRAHHRVLREHRIDRRVVRAMKLEQKFGILGMLLIAIGFVLEIWV